MVFWAEGTHFSRPLALFGLENRLSLAKKHHLFSSKLCALIGQICKETSSMNDRKHEWKVCAITGCSVHRLYSQSRAQHCGSRNHFGSAFWNLLWEENFWWEDVNPIVYCRTCPLFNIAIFKIFSHKGNFCFYHLCILDACMWAFFECFRDLNQSGRLSSPSLKAFSVSHTCWACIWLYLSKREK